MSDISKQFCDKLREAGAALGRGDVPEVKLPLHFIDNFFAADPDSGSKITAGYIRTIINRVPDVKAKGVVSVKRGEDENYNPVYVITIKTDSKRKVITSEDLPALEAAWKAKFIKELLSKQPRITDLEGDKLAGAAIALERLAAMLEGMVKE